MRCSLPLSILLRWMSRMRSAATLRDVTLLYSTLLACATLPLHAQWVPNGIPTGAGSGEQVNPSAAGDAFGTFVAWDDYRSGFSDIYLQKLGMDGSRHWTASGVAAVTAADHQLYPMITPDGAGGAIVVWEDYRSPASSGDIYVQRVSSAGQALWGTNGLLLCGAAGVQMRPVLVGDGLGGAYVAWEDYRGAAANIFAQHVSAAGTVSWASNGVRAATVNGARYAPALALAAGGGILVAWEENRVGTEYDIHAQYLNASGALQWGNGGLAVCVAAGFQSQLAGAPDDGGGMLLAWQDFRNGGADVYAQKLTTSGVAWANGGVAVCVASAAQESPRPASDGQGGAFIAWTDFRNAGGDVYAQRVSATGATAWQGNGLGVCTAGGTQNNVAIIADGVGGAVLTWVDYRVADGDIYTQRLNAQGSALWWNNGVAACANTATQQTPVVVSDQAGGGLIAWTDYRGATGNIFAQRVDHYGTAVPVQLLSFTGARDGAAVTLQWQSVTETNLHGYELQQGDGNGRFSTVAFVPAHAPDGGTYHSVITHTEATEFRLCAIDHDGSERVFPVLRIASAPASTLAITALAPLPARDAVTVGYSAADDRPLLLMIYDLSGARRRRIDLPAKAHGIHILPLDGLPSGMYVIELSNGRSTTRTRLPIHR